MPGDEEPQPGSSSTPKSTDASGSTEAAEDEDEDSEEEEGMIIKVVNPELQEERVLFDNISNLTALRLFNDVNIRPSPPLPPDTKRISPPHRLVDHSGWQEIYTGVTLWIYDKKSNTDNSVRLVSLEGDVYGTATYVTYTFVCTEADTGNESAAETVGVLKPHTSTSYS